MRTTVREQYTELLTDALAELRANHTEFDQLGDLNRAKNGLVGWLDETAQGLARFLGTKEARGFREQVNLNTIGMSGDIVVAWFTKYEDILSFLLRKAPTANITSGYAEDVRIPLEKIDELLEQIADLWKRCTRDHEPNYQIAEDGLRRWKERAFKILSDIIGEDEAGEIYSKRAGTSWEHPEGTLEEQFAMYVQFLYDIKEEIQKYPHHVISSPSAPRPIESHNMNNKKIFIAHGHGYLKDAVARVIERLKLDPIILQEKPSSGFTIIEKFEKYANVGYAVVLLTPDDVGGLAGGQMLDRARQNVIFELGYFVGKIGRGRVCLLYDKVELPSDLLGVVYVRFDPKDAWKLDLARELVAAGYDIDFNLLK